MPGKNQDISQSSLILGGITYPLGGDDAAVEITPDPSGSYKRGNASVIFEVEPKSVAIMVVSAYEQDGIYKALVAQHAAEQLLRAQGAPRSPQPGKHRNGAAGHVDVWDDAFLTQDFVSGSGKTAQVRTCTYVLTGHRRAAL